MASGYEFTPGAPGMFVDGPIAHGPNCIKTITGATTITKDDNGKTCIVHGAGDVITMTGVEYAGFKIKFITGGAIVPTPFIIRCTSGTIYGVLSVNAADVEATDADAINIVQTAETIGDWVELINDGTYWYVSGFGAAAGAYTFSDS